MKEQQPWACATIFRRRLKDAMKAGDKKRLSTLRLMQAAIKDKDINSRTDGP